MHYSIVYYKYIFSLNATGGQLGAGLLSIPIFAYVLSLEKEVEILVNEDDCDGDDDATGNGGATGDGEVTDNGDDDATGDADAADDGETRSKSKLKTRIIKMPRIHPAHFMSFAAMIKLCIQLPLTIMAAVNHDVMLLAAAGFAGGTSTGGQPQVTFVLLGWVMDDDSVQNNGVRREGIILSSNAAVQHCSFVIISAIIAIWGVLGLDTNVCPMDQPQSAKDAIFYTYTWLNGSWLLLYAISLMFYPLKGKVLERIVLTTTNRRRKEKEEEKNEQ